MCSVVESSTCVLSYQPRELMLPSSKSSWNNKVPSAGGGGGGGGVVSAVSERASTTSGALPVTLLCVAVIETLPALIPRTRPDVSTVAIVASLELQVTGRNSGRPRRSCSVTVA